MNSSNLAGKLKIARTLADLSQKVLASRLNLSEKTISAYEKGRAIPPVPTLEKIANITSQPIQFFIENGEKDSLEEISGKLDIIIRELRRSKNK
jgi:transcriptional regulator with XRE-family HTH domain